MSRVQPIGQLSTGELESELLGLAGHIAAAQCRFLQLLAEFDRRGGWAGPGLRSCAHWLSWRAGMSLRTAAEHVRVAHALARLPRVTEAFAAGRISYSKVRAITRVTGELPDDSGAADRAADQGADPAADQVADPAADRASRRSDFGPSPAGPEAARSELDPEEAARDRPDACPSEGSDSGGAASADGGGASPGLGAGPKAAPASSAPAPRWAPTAEVEQTLLQVALAGTASHLETVVRAVRRRTADPARAQAHRSLSWSWAEDGSLVLRGRLAPAEGAALIAAIDALAPPAPSGSAPAGPPPGDWSHRAVEHAPGPAVDRVAARRADALLTLVTTATDLGVDVENTDSDTGTDTEDTRETTGAGPAGHDHHGRCAHSDRPGQHDRRRPRRLSGPGRGGTGRGSTRVQGPVVRRGQATIIVHVDAATGTARIPGGPELPAATAERLACDARVQLLLSDSRSNRLYLGRTRRLATPAQIAALTLRDGARCQFSGCTHTRYLHAHHVVPWWRGGRTDLDNLVLVCSYHHTVIHDRGYGVRRHDDRWQVQRPDGTVVPDTGAPLAGHHDALIEFATRDGRLITARSLTPTWFGERLDPEPILDTLLPRTPAAAAA